MRQQLGVPRCLLVSEDDMSAHGVCAGAEGRCGPRCHRAVMHAYCAEVSLEGCLERAAERRIENAPGGRQRRPQGGVRLAVQHTVRLLDVPIFRVDSRWSPGGHGRNPVGRRRCECRSTGRREIHVAVRALLIGLTMSGKCRLTDWSRLGSRRSRPHCH
jgi:hypothetical protein